MYRHFLFTPLSSLTRLIGPTVPPPPGYVNVIVGLGEIEIASLKFIVAIVDELPAQTVSSASLYVTIPVGSLKSYHMVKSGPSVEFPAESMVTG